MRMTMFGFNRLVQYAINSSAAALFLTTAFLGWGLWFAELGPVPKVELNLIMR